MKYAVLSTIALLSFGSAAWAQNAAGALLGAESDAPMQVAMPLQPGDRFVRNANQCADESARAVWSRNDRLLGYSCYENPNGG